MATKKKKATKKVKKPTAAKGRVFKPSEKNKISIDAKNKVRVFVEKHSKYVSDVLKYRKNDITRVFKLEDEILALEAKGVDTSAQRAQLVEAKRLAIESKKGIDATVNKAIANKFYDLKVCFSYEQIKYSDYLNRLNKLRVDGENKVIALRSEIRDIFLNKQIDKETKKSLINANLKELKKAKQVAKTNRPEVKRLVRQAMAISREDFKYYFKLTKAEKKQNIFEARALYKDMCARFRENHINKITQIKQDESGDKKFKIDMKAEKIAYSARLNEAKTARSDATDAAKQLKYNAFMNKYGYSAKLKNDKHPISEWFQFKYESYIANFNAYNWVIKNALYAVILIVFIILVGLAAARGDNLLSGDSILAALVQISPKIFYALGVAGLILLAGTDLSIGRLTGVGVSFSLMLLSTQVYKDNNGMIWFDITGAPPAVKVICAILISIVLCTFFTTFAGFFTAKFKMHPFISTLAVQLISYGFFQLFWSATSSFTPDSNITDALRGANGWLLILYAAIAIIIVWFIWNKTRFGKHMYAVGGNQEAATVSGINPFTITLLVFVMAGVLYGFGGFMQALQTGTGNFNSGYGTETDAIAACVIGGVSFSGGVGKVGGAVLGAVILGFLTHAFSFIGVNSNLQLLIKGVIILVAVALDCVKYLRKK